MPTTIQQNGGGGGGYTGVTSPPPASPPPASPPASTPTATGTTSPFADASYFALPGYDPLAAFADVPGAGQNGNGSAAGATTGANGTSAQAAGQNNLWLWLLIGAAVAWLVWRNFKG